MIIRPHFYLVPSFAALLLGAFGQQKLASAEAVAFKTLKLSGEFHAEGAAVADFDKDGQQDVVSGPYLYFGPDFKRTATIYEGKAVDVRSYSKNFLTYTHDINSDGFDDVIVMGFPGEFGYWFENPKGKMGAMWKRWDVFNGLDNESPTFADITGDKKPEIICSYKEKFGYAEPNWTDPTLAWQFTSISPQIAGMQRFTHGLGFGDVNGDGRIDLLEKGGWWENPERKTQAEWVKHNAPFGTGGSQMFAYDFDGDGDNDVLSSLAAHAYGLSWFENKDGKGNEWQEHLIVGQTAESSPTRVAFSQHHAIDMADFNGDGVMDFVTGKRWFAHNGGDPGGMEPAVLYWFETKRKGGAGQVEFIPHFVHNDSGVGTQVMATDVNGDKLPDIVVGNKKGTYVHLQERVPADREGWQSLFDGKSLTGWEGDTSFWKVIDGSIVGESTPDHPCKANTFLIWRGGQVADFEFKAQFKLTGVPDANSGIQFRAQELPNFKVIGYQADIDNKANYMGVLWDEDGRGLLGPRGKMARFARDGKKEEREFMAEAEVKKSLKPGDWNEYHIVASGTSITLSINGQVTTQVIDDQVQEYDGHGKVTRASEHVSEQSGILALQLHSGGPTKIEWKGLSYKPLPGAVKVVKW